MIYLQNLTRYLFSAMVSWLWCYCVCANELGGVAVYPISNNDVLSGSVIHSVARDETGFLWVASDAGLRRYDGYELKNIGYQPSQGMQEGVTHPMKVYIDNSGDLWAATKLLNHYDESTEAFKQYDIADQKEIKAIYKDENDVVWYGGAGFGFRGYDLKTNKVIHQSLGNERARFVHSIAPDKHSTYLWIASSAGLFRFDSQTYQLERFDVPGDFNAGIQALRDVTVAEDGLVWLATAIGVIALNPETKEIKQYQAQPGVAGQLETNDLWSVYEDRSHHIWFGSDKHGAFRYSASNNNFDHIPASAVEKGALPLGAVTDIFEDYQGSMWFTVSRYGVFRANQRLNKFHVFRHTPGKVNGLSFDNVRGLTEDRYGNIWVATDGAGLNKLNPKTQTFTQYRHDPLDPETLASDSLLSVVEADDGKLWIGTWQGGVNILEPSSGKVTRIMRNPNEKAGEGLINNDIFRIFSDGNEGYYFSTWLHGLQHYHPSSNTYKTFNPGGFGAKSGIKNDTVNEMILRNDGLYWVLGHSGAELFDPATETFKSVELGDYSGVLDGYWPGGDHIWLGTDKGLLKYDQVNDTFEAHPLGNTENENYIASIEMDSRGDLWLGTRSGLVRYDPKLKALYRFDQRDGLAGDKFNMYSSLTTRDGKMYFGGARGLSAFEPLDFPLNTVPPKVILTDLEIFQKPVAIDSQGILSTSIQSVETIFLPYDQRDITFVFSALDFISPVKNRYRYRLLGLEGTWTEVNSDRRRVRYTNLDPGRYRFQVTASNNDGVWNEEGVFVNVIVKPPWWMTWWVRLLFVICVTVIISTVFLWRLSVTRQRQLDLQTKIRAKTKELHDAHRELKELNGELEARVEKRTEQLSVEVEERRLAEEKLFYMAFHDGLTGLANRAWLLQQLTRLIKRAQAEEGCQYGLLFLDGDRFKQINDTHGHTLGDLLLVAVAHRLQDMLGDTHKAIRLGGDEFTILIEDVHTPNELVGVAEMIVTSFEKAFRVEQNTMYFKVSIGMVLCDSYYTKPEQILRDADIALYKSKELGRGVYQMFDTNMREETLEIAELEADLHQAIDKGEFHLVFQPLIELENRELVSFEALLRWIHPTRGFIPPDKFIPLAEESGVIFSIGLWVLREAVTQLTSWINKFEFSQAPTIAVNLSPLQLSQSDLIERIDEILEESGIDNTLLKLEITESALMQQTESVNSLLDALRDRGIELAIDDFGTGYSSLSYLDQLPVQVLKIDRSFVNAMVTGKDKDASGANEIVRATVALSHNLNMKVVAEGIETEVQLETLKSFGCDFGQGYHIAKPMKAPDVEVFLVEQFGLTKVGEGSEGEQMGESSVASDKVPESEPVPKDRRSHRRQED